MFKKLFTVFLTIVLVYGCAGSAQHKVVSANQSGDRDKTCKQLDAEIVRAQVIIDGVNQDKNDVNGADWVDGILWFPFNLIAKQQNYKNALQSADRRIENLERIKDKKGCDRGQANQATIKAKSSNIVSELNKLTEMYKKGDLTKKEYEKAKKQLLK
jgi:hypothetical protein|tara:strand:+ start:288 stop:758 length:471 start_codon:yes stop_codon:yes gene_type:complete